jgi:hypothetical protein
LYRFLPGRGGSHDFHAVLAVKQDREPRSHDAVVVYYQNSGNTLSCGSTVAITRG